MPSSLSPTPESGPVAPGPQAVLIPSFSVRWLIGTLAKLIVLDAVGLAAMFALLGPLPDPLRMLSMLMIPLVVLTLTPLSVRWLEKRLDSLPSRPGEMPGEVVVHWIGLTRYGMPRIQGALALTGAELIFYRRRFRRWVEQMRIPLKEIAAVRAGKGLFFPKLVLTFHSGGIQAFQALYADRWREAILEVRDKA